MDIYFTAIGMFDIPSETVYYSSSFINKPLCGFINKGIYVEDFVESSWVLRAYSDGTGFYRFYLKVNL